MNLLITEVIYIKDYITISNNSKVYIVIHVLDVLVNIAKVAYSFLMNKKKETTFF